MGVQHLPRHLWWQPGQGLHNNSVPTTPKLLVWEVVSCPQRCSPWSSQERRANLRPCCSTSKQPRAGWELSRKHFLKQLLPFTRLGANPSFVWCQVQQLSQALTKDLKQPIISIGTASTTSLSNLFQYLITLIIKQILAHIQSEPTMFLV